MARIDLDPGTFDAIKAFGLKAVEAAMEAANRDIEAAAKDVAANISNVGIKRRSGRLLASIKVRRAGVRGGRTTPGRLTVDAINPVIPKRPGLRNPRMAGRYRHGAPYARFIEFSERLRRPFFEPVIEKWRPVISSDIRRAFNEARNK